MTNLEQRSISFGFREYATLFLRVALAATFLTSVTDRFGFWGSYGTTNIAWGDMTHFMMYAAKLNPWFPKVVIPPLAWLVTAAETLLAVALLLGLYTRVASQLSGWLLLAFAVGMTAGTGLKSALNASVFSASAGTFLLATSLDYPISIGSFRRMKDRVRAREQCVRSQLKNRCATSPDLTRDD
jgi:thiosulfate dehydrogenase (quinone) large subunit